MEEMLAGLILKPLPAIKRFVRAHKLFTGIILLVLIATFNSSSPLFWIYVTVIAGVVYVVRKYILLNPRMRTFFAPYVAFVEPYFRNRAAQKQLNAALGHDAALTERPPQIWKVEQLEHSIIWHARLAPGTTGETIARNAEHIASYAEVRNVRVLRDPENAGLVDIKLLIDNPLGSKTLNWPGDPTVARSIWDPISVGIDEDGKPLSIYLPERTLLVGGEPGSGKTVFLTILLMWVICCPGVKLFIFDGKEIDLSAYESRAIKYVGCNIDTAIEVLKEIVDEMSDRYAQLRKLGLKKITPGCGFSHIVVVMDELAFYIASGKSGKEFAELLRDLIARCRAAGIIVILTTQKPSADTVPTAIRDLISLRVAFRCGSIDASATILGQGWAGEGYSASTIPVSDRGIGYYLGDTGLPVLFRSYFVSPDQESAAISAALELCGSAEVDGPHDELEEGDA